MGGTAPKFIVIPAGALSLLLGAGLCGARCDGLGLSWPADLSFSLCPHGHQKT